MLDNEAVSLTASLRFDGALNVDITPVGGFYDGWSGATGLHLEKRGTAPGAFVPQISCARLTSGAGVDVGAAALTVHVEHALTVSGPHNHTTRTTPGPGSTERAGDDGLDVKALL
eukprot:gene6619-428_t